MKRRFIKIGYGIIALWMVCPLIPVIMAGIVAASCGCKVDEGSVHPCIVFGKDIGALLYGMGVMGWFAIGIFPTGMIALVIFSLIVRKGRHNADQDQEATDEDAVDTMRQDLVFWLGLTSLIFSFLTAIPALIIAARARPLDTRAKIGTAVAMFTLVVHVIIPIGLRLLRTH